MKNSLPQELHTCWFGSSLNMTRPIHLYNRAAVPPLPLQADINVRSLWLENKNTWGRLKASFMSSPPPKKIRLLSGFLSPHGSQCLTSSVTSELVIQSIWGTRWKEAWSYRSKSHGSFRFAPLLVVDTLNGLDFNGEWNIIIIRLLLLPFFLSSHVA